MMQMLVAEKLMNGTGVSFMTLMTVMLIMQVTRRGLRFIRRLFMFASLLAVVCIVLFLYTMYY